jgi:hypothetical protein
MLGEIPYMIVWGFFSAMGWMSANYTIEKFVPEKTTQEAQTCSVWAEEILDNGQVQRTRTCESKDKNK